MTVWNGRLLGARGWRSTVAGTLLYMSAALGFLFGAAAPAAAQDTVARPDTVPERDAATEVSPEHWPRVAGRLTDRSTGEPIAGATLRFVDLDASAVSDTAGRFVLPRVPPGTHELTIRHVAYGTRTVDVTVRADVTTRLRLELEPEAVELEPIEVEVEFRPEYLQEEGFYERMERGWGNHLDPERADRLFGPMASFEGRATLLKVLNTEFAMPSAVIDRRRSCARPSGWAVFVDRRPEEFYSVLGQLRGEEVGAVEVYPHGHGAPAWAMTPGCGILVIWTERW